MKTQNAELSAEKAAITATHSGGRGADLEDRLVLFGVRILRVGVALPRTEEGLHIRRQMFRAGTSAGANYHEARGGESRADFIHKVQIALKELRETQYWLKLIRAAELLPAAKLSAVLDEATQLIAIFVQSLVTARRNARDERT